MSWFKSLCLCLFVSACGFTPIYGPGGGGALQNAIALDDPDNKLEFEFVRAFEAQMGLPSAPRYALTYSLGTSTTGQAITGSNSITRFRIQGTATYLSLIHI